MILFVLDIPHIELKCSAGFNYQIILFCAKILLPLILIVVVSLGCCMRVDSQWEFKGLLVDLHVYSALQFLPFAIQLFSEPD